jgi:phage FluMu protein Com
VLLTNCVCIFSTLCLQAEKLAGGVFGSCPRFQCKRQSVLPIGLSENLRENHTALFCPRCQEIYEMSAPDRAFMTTMIQRSRSLQRGATSSGGSDASSSSGDPGPRSSISRGSWKCLPGLDGAYFGPSFPHMLLLQVGYAPLAPTAVSWS